MPTALVRRHPASRDPRGADHQLCPAISSTCTLGGSFPAASTRATNMMCFSTTISLSFDMKDFNGVTVGGEWLVGLSEHFDAGLGVGFYAKTVPTIY